MDEASGDRGFTVEVVGSGRHYVWNDDMTGMVERDGPIDTLKPWFLAMGQEDPPAEPVEWPAGWRDVGATTD